MPKIFEKKININYTIIGWVVENDEEVYKIGLQYNIIPNSIKHNVKKKEYIISRYLVHYLAKKYNVSPIIYKDENGKPTLKNANISISHAYPYVFASICMNHDILGLDVQEENSNLLRVQHRVFNDSEIKAIENCNLKACHFWICKEAAYKALYGFYSFKNDIFVKTHKSSSARYEYKVYCKNQQDMNMLHIKVEKIGIISSNYYLGYTMPNN